MIPDDESAVAVTFVSPHAVQGGAEAVMMTLVDELGPRWVAGIVVLQEGPFADELRSRGFNVCVIPASRVVGMLAAAVRLRRLLKVQKPQVVHANGVKAALVAGPAVLGLRARLLWMKHDTAGDGALSNLVARWSDAIVGVSDTVLRTFRGRARRRTAVVYNGVPHRTVDRSRGRKLVIEILGCETSSPVIVLVGRLCVGKGQHELLAAAPAILERHPRAHFALVGGDDPAFPGYADKLRAQARDLGIEQAVTLVGRRSDPVDFMAGCDILAVPSVLDDVHGWREGFGLVPVEALQAGTPVVGYASGALPEVLGAEAVLVNEGDRGALAAEISDLLDDPARRADLAERGRSRVAERYDLDRSIQALREQYRRLARSPR